uniref:Uncharacterized protein n=2 Tax=Lotus japonicus TaxID=34305 RepID=I3SCT1_LOTJA|nr:unknown [Lotus japonicus]
MSVTQSSHKCCEICVIRTLIFEIRLSDHNLKEGSKNYTVTCTFVPNSFTKEQSTQKTIQKESMSPQQISSDEEEPLVFKKKTKATSTKLTQGSSFDNEEISNKDDITSSGEEQILIQSLRTNAYKRTKVTNTNTTRKPKRITRPKK